MNPLLQKFRVLHEELRELLLENEPDEDILQKKIMKYIAYMAEDYRNKGSEENLFDYFCQNNGVTMLSLVLKKNSFIAIKAYSLLFINLKDEIWVNYILCQPFVKEALEEKCDANEEEWTQYYISFLKSLSIRLNETQISVFYNKKSCTYPIIYEAMKYFNHPDFMVRTSVMNIILELMKIKDPNSHQYFSRFPFTSYLITFTCEVHDLFAKVNKKLVSKEPLTSKYILNYSVDLSDYLYYYNDLIDFGTEKAIEVIRCSFEAYIKKPLLKMMLSQDLIEVKHSLLLLAECANVIKDPALSESLILSLLSPRIEKEYFDAFLKEGQVYLPLVYQQKFNPYEFFWDRYKNEIISHCLEVFNHIEQFEVDYDFSSSKDPDFLSELGRMSEFIDFDLLQNRKLKAKENKQVNSENGMENPFRSRLLQLLQSQDETIFSLALSLLLKLAENESCSQDVKNRTEMVKLRPKHESSSFASESPLEVQLAGYLFDALIKFNCNTCSIQYLQNTIKVLALLIDKRLPSGLEKALVQKGKEAAKTLLEYVTKENINQIVEHFQVQYQTIRQKMSSSKIDLKVSFVAGLFDKNSQDSKHKLSPALNKQKDIIINHIRQFWMLQIFLKDYLENNHQQKMVNFQQEYSRYFQGDNWKVEQRYKIKQKKTVTCDVLNTDLKRPLRVTLIEDPSNFMMAEMESDKMNYKMLIVSSWVKVSFEMNRDDSTKLETTFINSEGLKQFSLVFDDQVRSCSALASFNEIKWARYEEELHFIHKFLKRSIESE